MEIVAIENNKQLMELSHLDTMLARATHIDEITEVRARAEAMRVYAVNIRASRLVCQEYAMVRIRAERKAGQVLSALNLLGNNQHGRVSDESISLKDCGITPDESYRWRTIAQLPDGEFENSMLERFQSGDDITTSFFYKAAKIRLMRMRGISTDRPQRPEPEAEIDLKFAEFMLRYGYECSERHTVLLGEPWRYVTMKAIKEWKEQKQS